MGYDTKHIEMNLQELADTRTTLERDAERIRVLLHAPSSRFSVQLYTTYLEEQEKQIANIRRHEARLQQMLSVQNS